MQAPDVEHYLAALDEALVAQGIQTAIPVLLLGGAYIMLRVDARRSTQDIDVFPFVGGERDQATGLSLAVALYQAAETVAQRFQLHPHWLNTIRVGAMQPKGVTPSKTLWKKYQCLEVFIPDPEYVLLQKLLVNRQKDQADIAALFHTVNITERAQAEALLSRYLTPEEQEQHLLPVLLDAYFPDV